MTNQDQASDSPFSAESKTLIEVTIGELTKSELNLLGRLLGKKSPVGMIVTLIPNPADAGGTPETLVVLGDGTVNPPRVTVDQLLNASLAGVREVTRILMEQSVRTAVESAYRNQPGKTEESPNAEKSDPTQ